MRKTTLSLSFSFVIGLGAFVSVLGGDMEPPGPPDSTMVTLQQIYDRLAPGCARTGQTAEHGPGDDGEYKLGAFVVPRFTDNNDGSVTDNLTGLVWLRDANCWGAINWMEALAEANDLSDGLCELQDNSVSGEWRLPNVRELHSLIDYGNHNPPLPTFHPFVGVQTASHYYWSSTTNAHDSSYAWDVYLGDSPDVRSADKSYDNWVWPVRNE